MDTQSYSRLLSYVFCEMTMPIKKHVYNFAVNDQLSMKPELLTAAALTAETQTQQVNTKKMSSNLYKITNTSDSPVEPDDTIVSENEIEELVCEGTEIEKSALGNSLRCDKDKFDEEFVQKPSCASSNLDWYEFSDAIREEGNTANTPRVLKRRLSGNENQTSPESVIKKSKDDVLKNVGEDEKCGDGIRNENVTDENCQTINQDSTLDDSLLLSNESDFKVMYKISRSTFQIVVEMLSEEELEPIENVSLQKKVLVVLWLLGTSGSYKEAAQVFGVSEEAVSSCFFDICATLYNKSENFIKWPSSDESDDIASRIETNYGFPGVVGVLGCQYFTITIPKESLSRREHFNGKLRMYCVALQLVCDDEFVIRDIFPGLPGGIRPAQVLRDSQLGEILTTQANELIDPNKHILASSEFPQLTSMLTPYSKKSEALTKEEEEFNVLHGSVCLLVDQTFKMLKDRFRILKRLDPETATMVLVTTCVLHNICMRNGDTYNIDEIA